MEIKILPTRKFFEKDITYIKSKLSPVCEFIIPHDYSLDTLKKHAHEANIFFGGLISKELCSEAPKLKFIQVPWTGVDNLNFKEIEEIGITVCNSHSNAYAVAEHAISLLFDIAKKISYHDVELRKGNWNRPKQDGVNEVSPFSRRISNSKIGIIGFGHIGKTIKEFLSGFSCEFHIVDATINDKYENGNSTFYPIIQIDELLPFVDFIFISVPLTEKTNSFINAEFFSKLNNSAILINISRGEVINEDALYYALINNQISGAGIDTWYNYPKNSLEPTFPSLKNPFHGLKNLVLSPHRSAFIDGELPHLNDAIDNINRAAKGLDPLNIVSTLNKY